MKKCLISALALIVGAPAFAQNLNPTVEVTNAYEREASGIEKPSQLLEVPDSLLRFNLDFDYAVMQTPYRGAYEFSPYLVDPRPGARPSGEHTLFLRAGAGYGLHPELSALWTPVRTENFRLGVYADHHSYLGQYHNIAKDAVGNFLPDGTSRYGKDLRTTLGADARFAWKGGAGEADLSYQNLTTLRLAEAADLPFNKVQLKARVGNVPGSKFDWNASTRLSWLGTPGFGEFHSVTEGGAQTTLFHRQLGLKLGLETLSNSWKGLSHFWITPHYVKGHGRLQVDAGVKLSLAPGFHVSPDVHASLALLPEHLVLWGSATGGAQLNAFTDLLEGNPFMPLLSAVQSTSFEVLNLQIGARGQAFSRLHYSAGAGFVWTSDALLPAYAAGNLPDWRYVTTLLQFRLQGALGWHSEVIDAEASLRYNYAVTGLLNANDPVFLPAPLSGSVSAFYKWGTRLKAGAQAEFASARTSSAALSPRST